MTRPVDPRVTVVMTAWNSARFIEVAVQSVLDQTVMPGRIVLVDDGSTDGCAEMAAKMSPIVDVVRQEHRGCGPARSTGIAATDTSLVALLDSDDVWLPERLERELAVIDDRPDVEVVFCAIDEFEDFAGERPPGLRPPVQGVTTPLTSAALLRRSVLDRLGSFPDVPVGDWIEWWARARRDGVTYVVLPEALVRRRIHGANNSLQANDDGRTLLAIARRHLAETRAQGTGP